MSSPAPTPASRPSPASRALELLLYVVVCLGAVAPALAPGRVVGDGIDLFGTFWFYWWIGDSIEHLRDPSFTDMMFHPLGKDIFSHTGNNFVDAVAAFPFQALLPYPDYQPWFVAFLLLVNGLTFRPLARDLLRTRTAVVGATVLWIVNPFVLFELIAGRPTQAFLWFLPLAVRHFLHIGGVEPGSARMPGAAPHGWRWRDPILCGLFTALQAWTYWFMGWFMAFLFAWLAVVDLARRPERARRVAGYVLAAAACVLAVLPAAIPMLQNAGEGLVPGLVATAGGGDGPAALANNVSTNLHGYWLTETIGQPMFWYLSWGVGLLVAAILAPDRLRWIGAWVVAIAFALGPVVPVGDGIEMPHYLLAYQHLPFFDRLWFPLRLVVIAMLAAAVLLGMLLDRVELLRRARLPRAPAWAFPALFIGLALVEQHRVLAYPLLNRDLTPPPVYEVIGAEGGGLVELPIGLAKQSLAYQPVHEQFLFGGMAENAPIFWPDGYRKRLRNTFIAWLQRTTRDPDRDYAWRESDKQALVDEGFRWVILDRQLVDADIHRWSFARRVETEQILAAPFMAQENIIEGLGPPVMVDERLVVWDLWEDPDLPGRIPAALAPTPEKLGERTWSVDEMPEYEQWLRETGRLRGLDSDGGTLGPGAGGG